jgi:hypothetical protein
MGYGSIIIKENSKFIGGEKMITDYVFENRKYDIALRDVKAILFDIVMSEQEKVTSIISKVKTTGNEELQEKLLTLCNEQGECLRNLLEISNSFSENLQLLDSYSRELKKIENKNIANIISEIRSETANAKKKKKAQETPVVQEQPQQQEPVQNMTPEQAVQPEVVAQPEVPQQEVVAEQAPVTVEQAPVVAEQPAENPVAEEKSPVIDGDIKLDIPLELMGKKLTFNSTAKPIVPEGATQAPVEQPEVVAQPEVPQEEAVVEQAPVADQPTETPPAEEQKSTVIGDIKLDIPADLMGKKLTFKSTAKPIIPEGETPPQEEAPKEETPAPVMEEPKPENTNDLNIEIPEAAPTPAEQPVVEQPIVEESAPVVEEQPAVEETNPEPVVVETPQPAEETPVENVEAVEAKPLLPLMPEEPVVETTQPVVETTPEKPENQSITTIKKENTDEAKAIITSAKQTESLRNSFSTQETLLNESGFFQNNANAVTPSDENLEKDLIQNGLLPQEGNDLQKEVEQKMAEANKLYAEGKVEEAQKIFDEINNLGSTVAQQETIVK